MKIAPLNNYKITNQQKKSQNFNGMGDMAFNMLDKGFKILDKNAMIQVSFIDISTGAIPRTLLDMKTSLAAAFETCRRELSGLIVNCLTPGLIVMGIAKLLPKSKELQGTNPAKSWANADSINKFKEIYKQAQASNSPDTTKAFIESSLANLEGLDGRKWVKFKDKINTKEFKGAVDDIATAVGKKGKERTTLLSSAREKLVSVTKTENILKFNGQKQANLQETLRDITDLGSKFSTVKEKALESGDKDIIKAIDKYSNSLTKFVNKKSLIGLAIVISIAVSIQKINRAITKKQFNAEGAPIYKDFGKKDTKQKMTEEEKKKFAVKKGISALEMFALAGLSMMKKPSLGMFQFSGIFPTLDQCRWIAASTFASRMLAAEDENELRESKVRDTAGFLSLYFLGDYVKKAAASGFEALSKTQTGKKLLGENVVLLNRSKEIVKPVINPNSGLVEKGKQQAVYRMKQFGNWVKNTELKTASEVSSTKLRNMRNICRVADIAFSMIALGILLPKYNRSVTEKKVEMAKKQEEAMKKSIKDFDKNKPAIFKEI